MGWEAATHLWRRGEKGNKWRATQTAVVLTQLKRVAWHLVLIFIFYRTQANNPTCFRGQTSSCFPLPTLNFLFLSWTFVSCEFLKWMRSKLLGMCSSAVFSGYSGDAKTRSKKPRYLKIKCKKDLNTVFSEVQNWDGCLKYFFQWINIV